MKKIELTQGYFATVDDELFETLNQYSWSAFPVRGKHVYAKRKTLLAEGLGRKTVFMHRQITNAQQGFDVDHRDGDGLNNTMENLRVCTRAQNQQNNKTVCGLSKFKGVNRRTDRPHWRVYLRVNTKKKYMGSFKDEEMAGRTYDFAALANFGEFANINFPLAKSKYLSILEAIKMENPEMDPLTVGKTAIARDLKLL